MTSGISATIRTSGTSTGDRLAGELLRVDFGFERLENATGCPVQPDFKRQFVDIVIEAPARGDGEQLMRESSEEVLAVDRDGHALAGHAQVLAHDLQAFVFLAVHPRQHLVARKEIRPLLESFWHVNAQLE